MSNYINRASRWLLATGITLVATSMLATSAFAQSKGNIKIAEADWTGNLVQIHLAKAIMEEHMGYDVELVLMDYTAQWVAMEAGDIHLGMELWEDSSAGLMAKFLPEYGGSGAVSFLGDTGVEGKSGYFVPTYVVKGDAARGIDPVCPNLKTWKDLNECAEAFATVETAPKGRWMGCPIIGWLCGDVQRVENLGLNFEAIAIGSEPAHWAELEAQYSRGLPILIEIWEPHWVHAKYDLTRITLPPATDECWNGKDGAPALFDCDFPQDKITYHIGNPEFLNEHPDVAQFVKNMHLTNDAQAGMLMSIDVEGRDIVEVVTEWMAANEATWKPWLP